MKRNSFYVILATISAGLTSCIVSSSNKSSSQNDSIFSCSDSIISDISVAVEIVPELEIDNFEFVFFKESAKSNTKTNFATSPVEASFAISMIANICDSDLQQQISKALKYKDLYQLNKNSRQKLRHITKQTSNTKAYLGNALWLTDNLHVNLNKNKRDSLLKYFNATIDEVDFTSDNTLTRIKKWGQNVTHGHITPSLSQIEDRCCFILTTLMYYSGYWINTFNKNETQLRTFHKYDGDTIVHMMSQTLYSEYYKTTDFKAVTLDLENNYSMLFLLPRKDITADSLISLLTTSHLSRIKNNAQLTNLQLSIPKFQINTRQDALETLKSIGFYILPSKFNEMGMDRIEKIGMDQFSKITIDESGVEASSEITMISCILSSPEEDEPQPITVRFDRPFVFLLHHNSTGAILMAGQYTGPEE